MKRRWSLFVSNIRRPTNQGPGVNVYSMGRFFCKHLSRSTEPYGQEEDAIINFNIEFERKYFVGELSLFYGVTLWGFYTGQNSDTKFSHPGEISKIHQLQACFVRLLNNWKSNK